MAGKVSCKADIFSYGVVMWCDLGAASMLLFAQLAKPLRSNVHG